MIYNQFPDISLGHYTHEKSPLGAMAALTTLEIIEEEKILHKVAGDSLTMFTAINILKDKYGLIGDVRGRGLLWGVELVKDRNTKEKAVHQAEQVMYECLKNGLSFKVSAGNVLQLAPALTISRKELKNAIQILDNALASVSN